MTVLARLALWCMKNAWSPERLVRDLPKWAPLFEEAAAGPRGREALEPILVYIWRVSDRPTGQRFARRLASEVNETMEKEFVSAGDVKRHEGASRVLVRQLERRFGPLPSQARERIEAASTEQIEQWALRVIDASSLDDVLASD